MNPKLKNRLVHNAIPDSPKPNLKNKLVHNDPEIIVPDSPDPRHKIVKKGENPTKASTTNDILLKSPCLLAHLLQGTNSSQYTFVGKTPVCSDMAAKTSAPDISSTECFPANSSIINDQLSPSYVPPIEIIVEKSELHPIVPDSAKKRSTSRRKNYPPTKAELVEEFKHKDSLRKVKEIYSSYVKKRKREKNFYARKSCKKS